jgi:hypothetical protein
MKLSASISNEGRARHVSCSRQNREGIWRLNVILFDVTHKEPVFEGVLKFVFDVLMHVNG